ncbi:MAG: hypothetical protein Fur005_08750 [Roseiflexaceae bacterium]
MAAKVSMGHARSVEVRRSWHDLPWGFLLGMSLVVAIVVGTLWFFWQRDQSLLRSTVGIFAPDGEAPFRWTSSEVHFDLAPLSPVTRVELTLAAGGWPDRPAPEAALQVAGWPRAPLGLAEQPRRFMLLAPATAPDLVLAARADKAPGADPRYLGVRLYDAAARPLGQPIFLWRAGLIVAAVVFGLTIILGWATLAERGLLLFALLLGAALRLYLLDQLPAGFFQDEAVAMVDAWSLLQTGRDHLGAVWPLGAFESFGDWVSPLLNYTLLPSVWLFGPTPFAARLPAAIAGTLAIPAAYLAARAFGLPRWAAGFAALVVALSPWQILRSRVASPPALVPLMWLLTLWAGCQLVRWRTTSTALWLALLGGLALHSYPTMKLAVPLLVAAAVVVAVWAEWASRQQVLAGMQRSRPQWWQVLLDLLGRWWSAALLIGLIWLPFIWTTLFNEASGMRASRKILQAETPLAWIVAWLEGYATYFLPAFYYQSGDPSNGSAQGVQLLAEAPLVLIGLVALVIMAIGRVERFRERTFQSRLLLIALLLAPLPASLMAPNPHLTRALIVAPMYALLVALGIAMLVEWWPTRAAVRPGQPATLPNGLAFLAVAWFLVIFGQGLLRYQGYLNEFPRLMAQKYQDGTREAFEQLVARAPAYAEVWVDDRLPFPYIYVLAAGGVPLAEAQQSIVVDRPGTTFNTVKQVGKYRFTDLKPLPAELPTLFATVNSLGQPGFVIQEWRASDAAQPILIIRRMR